MHIFEVFRVMRDDVQRFAYSSRFVIGLFLMQGV